MDFQKYATINETYVATPFQLENIVMNAQQFARKFASLWNIEVAVNSIELRYAFSRNPSTTCYMIDQYNSFLYRLANICGFEIKYELKVKVNNRKKRLDAAYFKHVPKGKDECRIGIEHENGERDAVLEAMKRLQSFNSSLKVLIFYNYRLDFMKGNEDWLNKTNKKLFDLASNDQNSEYLFLVGQLPYHGGIPKWRYWILKNGEFELEGANLC